MDFFPFLVVGVYEEAHAFISSRFVIWLLPKHEEIQCLMQFSVEYRRAGRRCLCVIMCVIPDKSGTLMLHKEIVSSCNMQQGF